MIEGYFGQRGELYFELDLIDTEGFSLSVEVLLDTGFTDWLAMNTQDVESLGWPLVDTWEMYTARGDAQFDVYAGKVVLDSEEFNILVLGGTEIKEILIGVKWLEERRLVADRKTGLLVLE
jgi:clan AA aspartic protease